MYGCTKKTGDPLLLALLGIGINPLRIVRRETPLGKLYVIGKASNDGPSQQIWDAEDTLSKSLAAIPTEALTTPPNQPFEVKVSNAMDLDAATKILARFVPGLDAVKAAAFTAAIRRRGVTGMSFKIEEPSCQRLSMSKVQLALADAHITPVLKAALGKQKLYLVVGAWAAKRLQTYALNKDRLDVEIAAELKSIIAGDGKLKLKTLGRRDLVFESEEPLYFGAELMRVDERPGGGLFLQAYRPEEILANDAHGPFRNALADIWSDEDEEVVLMV